ncbi:uncharacterized protein BO95DRAFT_433930 [Aspergillus brunneoviolaceus CBS 621.78]|uniref:Uncharacterized protein n=1 Tax=Aspergillus brunneoviolaceus CBS 621.78 TaxID=1450534 RepID=A0ACD1G2V4_9EURO|nr:hypothetical protein BO95DRAFT_433930 [Aspergillus brunneoviolaceus CBS 621.78]RAH43486.1 hypothetical protein BO95DRAFT_433930 [Aspergillus brunneoviolaceus CBS 621.78]
MIQVQCIRLRLLALALLGRLNPRHIVFLLIAGHLIHVPASGPLDHIVPRTLSREILPPPEHHGLRVRLALLDREPARIEVHASRGAAPSDIPEVIASGVQEDQIAVPVEG